MRTIHIDNNKGTKQVDLKNISIKGKNYYGPINVQDNVKGVSINYFNINYEGPRLVHNIHGFTNFDGEKNISIKTLFTDFDPS